MSLNRFCIEQLCLSIDSMISLVFEHYVFSSLTFAEGYEESSKYHWKKSCVSNGVRKHTRKRNLNVNENHVQYVRSKTDDSRGSHSTQFESLLIVSTKTGKKIFEN